MSPNILILSSIHYSCGVEKRHRIFRCCADEKWRRRQLAECGLRVGEKKDRLVEMK